MADKTGDTPPGLTTEGYKLQQVFKLFTVADDLEKRLKRIENLCDPEDPEHIGVRELIAAYRAAGNVSEVDSNFKLQVKVGVVVAIVAGLISIGVHFVK